METTSLQAWTASGILEKHLLYAAVSKGTGKFPKYFTLFQAERIVLAFDHWPPPQNWRSCIWWTTSRAERKTLISLVHKGPIRFFRLRTSFSGRREGLVRVVRVECFRSYKKNKNERCPRSISTEVITCRSNKQYQEWMRSRCFFAKQLLEARQNERIYNCTTNKENRTKRSIKASWFWRVTHRWGQFGVSRATRMQFALFCCCLNCLKWTWHRQDLACTKQLCILLLRNCGTSIGYFLYS